MRKGNFCEGILGLKSKNIRFKKASFLRTLGLKSKLFLCGKFGFE
jgi:hypothetical protein